MTVCISNCTLCKLQASRVSFQISGLNRCVLIRNGAYKCLCLLAPELISGNVARRLLVLGLFPTCVPLSFLLFLFFLFHALLFFVVVYPIRSQRPIIVITLVRVSCVFSPRQINLQTACWLPDSAEEKNRAKSWLHLPSIDTNAKCSRSRRPPCHSKLSIFFANSDKITANQPTSSSARLA